MDGTGMIVIRTIVRTLLLAASLMLAAQPSHAQNTKSALTSQISQDFPDNTTGAITPAIVRTFMGNMVNSFQQYAGVNAQVGTTYTIQLSDYGQLVTFSNTSPVAVTLPAATTTGFNPFNFYVSNLNSGLVTITPATGTINGAASFAVTSGTSAWIVSDGTNYQVFKGFGSGAVNSATAGNVAWYAAIGSTVSGNVNANMALGALTLGIAGTTQGQLVVAGSSSGGLTITTQAAAGTPTWTAGTASGTPAVTATSPLAISSTTGNITCSTCVTGTSGALTVNVTTTSGATAGQVFFSDGTKLQAYGITGTAGSAVLSASPTFTGIPVLAAPTATSVAIGGCTIGTDAFCVTGTGAFAGTFRDTNASGWTLIDGAASGTVPTLVPNRAASTTGIGAQASGNISLIVAGTEIARVISTGFNVQSGNLTLPNAGSIIPASNSTTALFIANAANSSKIVTIDTTNLRVGINKTPGAFDLDTNGALNVGTTLTFTTLSPISLGASTSTITGLTVNNSPNASNDYLLYYSAADGAIRKVTVGSIAAAATGGVQNINGLCAGTGCSIAQGSGITVSSTGTTITVNSTVLMPGGRLTLVTATPVMITSQSAKTTLYYDCYQGNAVPYYNGSTDTYDTISACEVSTAMVSAASAGQVVSANVYDVWWVHGGANRICLAMSASGGGGGGWASDTAGSNTARGTGYSQLDYITRPYITNKNAISNCFNGATNYGTVAVNQGTYLGTIYATGNGSTGYIFGSIASGGGVALFGVWNMYNRVKVDTIVGDNTDSWTVTNNGSWASVNASTGNRISVVTGIAEDSMSFENDMFCQGTVSTNVYSGIGINSTSAPTLGIAIGSATLSGAFHALSKASTQVVGFNFAQALQYGNGSTTLTCIGDAGTAFAQTGLSGHLRM